MPAQYPRVGPTTLDQFTAYMAAHSDVRVIDIRADLLAAKDEGMLYWAHDSHWNPLGAYYGYRSIASQLDGVIPAPEMLDLSDLRYVERDTVDELGRMMGLTGMFTHPRASYVPRRRCAQPAAYGGPDAESQSSEPILRRCDSRSLRALLFRDSFMTYLIPTLSEHFGETLYVWSYVHRTGNFAELVAYFQPDIVIEEMVERELPNFTKADELALNADA
jgi:alginate O-acetyltransferase complex protein AlgJ